MAELSSSSEAKANGTLPCAADADHVARVAAYYGRSTPTADPLRASWRAYDNLGYWAAAPGDFSEAGFRLAEALVTRVGVDRESDVLDVGCGFGASSLDLASVWGCRRVTGIDVTKPMLSVAAREAAREGVQDRVSFRAMSATALEFPDASFSHVLAIDCACLFLPRTAFLREAFRALRPGGVLGLSDAIPGAPAKKLWQRASFALLAHYWNVPSTNRYGAEEYRKELAQIGFESIAVECVGQHVFPGAAACARTDAFRREERKGSGFIPATGQEWALRFAAQNYECGLLEYALIVARKPLR